MSGFNNVTSIGQQLVDNVVGGNIGGILSTRPQAKYMSGARTVLRMNGQIVGFAFSVGWKITTAYKDLYVIDDPLPAELIPQRIRVDGRISALHVPGVSAGTELWQADPLSFLFHRYLSIEVRDSATNRLLFYAPKAVITSRDEDIKVDSLAHVQLNFLAIGFRDEKTPSIPEHYDTLSREDDSGLYSPVHKYHNIDASSQKTATDKIADAAGAVVDAVKNIF